MAEAQIRPVFQRTRFTERSKFNGESKTFTSNTSSTLDIKPPVGTLWSINYLQVKHTISSGSSVNITIFLNNNGTQYILAKSTTALASISFASFGNGPIIASSTSYPQLYCQANASGGSPESFESVAVYEVY